MLRMHSLSPFVALLHSCRSTKPFTAVTLANVVSVVFAAPLAAGLMSITALGLKGWQCALQSLYVLLLSLARLLPAISAAPALLGPDPRLQHGVLTGVADVFCVCVCRLAVALHSGGHPVSDTGSDYAGERTLAGSHLVVADAGVITYFSREALANLQDSCVSAWAALQRELS